MIPRIAVKKPDEFKVVCYDGTSESRASIEALMSTGPFCGPSSFAFEPEEGGFNRMTVFCGARCIAKSDFVVCGGDPWILDILTEEQFAKKFTMIRVEGTPTPD